MGIRLATFQQHQLTAQDYALLCAKSVSSGIFYGCNVTIKDESTLHVTSGVGIANGRTFDVTDDDYPVELTGGGSMVGRIYVHVDLADVDTPAQILVVKGATLPALVQDSDMNESTGVWDLELATFDVDASEISNLVYTASGVSGGGGGTMLAPYYDASEAWLKDQIFQKDGVLYKCLTDIAPGTPLVVDTNVKVTDFAEETEALNQNLTINLEDTSLPSSTTFNELIEMMAEKLYPNSIDLLAYPQNKWNLTQGSATYNPLSLTNTTNGGNGYYYATIETLEYIDLTNFSSLSVGIRNNHHMHMYLIDEISQATQVIYIDEGGTGLQTRTADLTSYSGNYKIKVQSYYEGQYTLNFTQLKLE